LLVLASASPRRQEILRNAGIEFVVQPTQIPEIPNLDEPAREFAERMAREKATIVSGERTQDLVLGADTVVVVEGEILGKPESPADAARMLRLLSGRTHIVITGVCLLGPESGSDVRSETTLVTMLPIPEQEILSYAASEEPKDKAGAYAIQGIASRWISRIEGDYFNVVGLPMSLVYKMLRQHGAV